MYTLRQVPAWISLLVSIPLFFPLKSKARDYRNFQLPKIPIRSVPPSDLSFEDKRVKLKGELVQKNPSIDQKEFLFAKQQYLSEKRDEAIKLLRQQIEAGNGRKLENLDNMLLKLGQLYTEKYMEYAYIENDVYNKQLIEYQNKRIKKPPKLNNSRSNQNLKLALKTFMRLQKSYPKHPKMDEILFFVGFVNMEMGKVALGSNYLDRMLREYPRSPKVDEALLYMGDYNFDHRQFKKAEDRFEPILRKKKSELYHYALYKTAWCQLNTGKKAEGLANMKKVISSLENEEETSKFNLRSQAISDILVFFVELEKVDEAVDFFTEKLGREKAMANLRIMAASLLAAAKDRAAIRAYGILVEEYGDSKDAPKLQLALYEAYGRMGQHNKANSILTDALDKFSENSHWAKSNTDAEGKESLSVLKEQGMKAAYYYHHTGQKTRNKNYYDFAQKLYGSLIQNYPSMPEKRQFIFFQAEILYKQGKYREAADQYMIIARNPPDDKLAEEAAYNALLAVDQMTFTTDKIKRYSLQDQKDLNFAKEPILEKEQQFLDVSEFYLKKYPKSDKATDVKFRMASLYYRRQHFEEAFALFKEIALNHPKHQSATTAANVSLDILNIQKDFTGLSALANTYSTTKGLGDSAFRADLKRINSEIAFKEIEKLEKTSEWDKAGAAYLAFFKNNPKGNLAEQSLYNAVVSFEKSSDSLKSAEVSKLFISHYPNHEYAKKISLRLAKFAEKQYRYEEAQIRYYEFYKTHPKDTEATKALYNAAVYAEIMEKDSLALQLYGEYLSKKGVSVELKKAILLSQIKIYKKQKRWSNAIGLYDQLLNMAATTGEKAALLGEMSQLYKKLNYREKYENTLARIRGIAGDKPDPDTLGTGFKYVGEAKFVKIAPDQANYNRIRLKLPPATLVKALKEKQQWLVRLDKKYSEVVALGIPEWGVAALYENAMAYDEFVQSYRKISVTGKYSKEEKEELEKQIKEIDDEVIRPLELKVANLLKLCSDKASEFHVISDYVAKCNAKAQGEQNTPVGVLPDASYWTTRWVSDEVASR